ncbi:polysaccharide lyase family 8 super-sandwich domain-containing protein [Longispora sp. NPDC051575]|uniref:polysaccharide lyase family 8 super-sandwich domain-containing protein n=1 Tax=Longispora sp. NPDC051575 TaxID=3154943 RepID=UPI003412A0F6
MRRRIGTTLALVLAATLLPSPASASPDTDAMRTRWTFLATGGNAPASAARTAAVAALDVEAQGYLDTLDLGAATPWPDLAGTATADMTGTARRAWTIACDYATPGARHHGDPAVRDQVNATVRWLLDNRYNPARTEGFNWWDWEIGTPNLLLDTLLLTDATGALRTDGLAAVAHFVPDPTKRTLNGVVETGANRVDKAYVTVRRGVLAGDGATIARGRDALTAVFDPVTAGDGFYADGSFVQHGYFAYTGSYGLVLLGGIARALYLLDGSPWAVTAPGRANVARWIFDAYEPVVFRGQVFADVRGRAIARSYRSDDHDAGADLAAAVALVAPTTGAADRARMAGMVAEWLAADTLGGGLKARMTVPEVVWAEALVAGAVRRGDLAALKVYGSMDRLAYHRPGYAWTVSARSSRIGAYEAGNGENLRGWYTGDGMTALYNGDLAQFSDGYWPTVDPYRLPGTTTATRATYPRSDTDRAFAGYRQPDPWVGGAALDATAGAYGMRFSSEKDPAAATGNTLTGRKSWFMVGDVLVALGSDISATNVAAQTTVENRKVPAAGATVTVDGVARTSKGWSQDLIGARWAHVDGVGGYVFPAGGTLKGLGETRTGDWADIGAGAPESVTREYATLWFEHGTNPTAQKYAYVQLPNASVAATAAFAARPTVAVGDNSPTVQSVTGGGVTAANFWSCASTLGQLRAHGPASVVTRTAGSAVSVAVGDPTQKQDSVLVELARAGTVTSKDPRIAVLSTSPTIKLQVSTRGLAGAAVRASFTVDGTTPALSTSCALAPTADAYVRGGSYATQNLNGQGLVVKQAPGAYDRVGYLSFDVPAGRTAATLWVHGQVADSGGTSTTVTAHGVAGTWSETAVTYDTRPATGAVAGSGTVAGTGWYPIDVSSWVLGRSGRISVALHGSALAVVLADRESATGLSPYLAVS